MLTHCTLEASSFSSFSTSFRPSHSLPVSLIPHPLPFPLIGIVSCNKRFSVVNKEEHRSVQHTQATTMQQDPRTKIKNRRTSSLPPICPLIHPFSCSCALFLVFLLRFSFSFSLLSSFLLFTLPPSFPTPLLLIYLHSTFPVLHLFSPRPALTLSLFPSIFSLSTSHSFFFNPFPCPLFISP